MKIFIIFFVFTGFTWCQGIAFHFGYTEYSLPEQHRIFSSLVHDFNAQYPDFGIPVQKEFPGNALFSGTLALYEANKVRFGFQFSTGSTSAFALYGDQLGQIDMKSKYDGWLLGAFIEKVVGESPYLNLSIGSNLGIGSADYNVETSIRYPQFPQYDSSSHESYSKTLLAVEPYFLLSAPVYGQLTMDLHLGYRFGGSIEATDQNDNSGIPQIYQQSSEPTTPAIGINGVVVSLGMELHFSWPEQGKANPVSGVK